MMRNRIQKSVLKKLMVTSMVFVILAGLGMYYHFWTAYSQEQTKQDDLNFQIDQFWPRVQAGVPEPPANQEERLAVAQEKLEVQQNAFPIKINSMALMETLLDFAQTHQVNVSLQTRLFPAGFDDEFNCDLLQCSVKASGSLADLQAFICELEEGPIETLSLDRLNLSRSGQSWNADFNLNIYTRIPPSAIMSEET